jgi:hypothetical protein
MPPIWTGSVSKRGVGTRADSRSWRTDEPCQPAASKVVEGRVVKEHTDDADPDHDGNSGTATKTWSRSTEDKRAEGTVGDDKEGIVAGQIDELRTDTLSTAATLYREANTFLGNNEEVSRATAELRGSIRRNPLAAVGTATIAGFVLAL